MAACFGSAFSLVHASSANSTALQIVERLAYVPVGWIQSYSFSFVDLNCGKDFGRRAVPEERPMTLLCRRVGLDVIDQCTEREVVDFVAIRSLLCDFAYGYCCYWIARTLHSYGIFRRSNS